MIRIFLACALFLFPILANAQALYSDAYSRGLDLMRAHKQDSAFVAFSQAYLLAQKNTVERNKALWGKGMSIYDKAATLNKDQDYERAYTAYEEALGYFSEADLKDKMVDCMYAMAELNFQHFEDFEKSEVQYQDALALAKEHRLVESQVDILSDLVALKKRLHRADEAAMYAMEIDHIISSDDALSVRAMINRGELAFRNGEYDIAISYYKHLLDTPDHEIDDVILCQRIRDAYIQKDDYVNALDYSGKCVEAWKKMFADDPKNKYMVYRTHFSLQLNAGDTKGALASLDSLKYALAYDQSPLAKGDYYMDRGRVYAGMKEWGNAVKSYVIADSLFSVSERGVAVSERIKLLVPLHAVALYHNGEIDNAHEKVMRNLDLCRESYGEKSNEYVQALGYVANIEGYLHRYADGASHYITAWETIRDITSQDLQMLPSNARGSYWQQVNYLMWNMVPYAIAAGYQQDQFTASAFEALMFSKGLMLSLEKSMKSTIESLGDDAFLNDFSAMANLRNEIEVQRAAHDGAQIMKLYARMDSIDRRLSVALSSRGIFPPIYSVRTSDVAKCLAPGEALIDFVDYTRNDGSHQYAAFVMRHGMDAPRVVKVFEQAQLDSLLQANSGVYPDLYLDYNQDRMRELLWAPLMDDLTDIHTVYFVPSGILHQIALEAIMLSEGDYACDCYNIVRLSNSREILRYPQYKHISDFSDACLYGGLEYDVDPLTMASAARHVVAESIVDTHRGTLRDMDVSEDGFKKLPVSEQEVIEISDILTQSNIDVTKLTDTEGTEESFFALSGASPDLLMLSTHGFYFSPENVPSWSSLNGYDNPMYLTGLVMSGGNAEYLKRDIPEGIMGGLLTSSEIASLDFSGTQLVVLSACETALGETTNEGVYGLQRAFKKAGAQTLVMSLWPVSDVASKDFMIQFHHELARCGWDKRMAFNKARSAMRVKYVNPYYWAAFVMVD